MSKYRVSIAVRSPENYEVIVEAETPADATRAAIRDFNCEGPSGEFKVRTGSFEEVEGGDVMLALDNPHYEGQEMDEFGGVAVWIDEQGSWEEVY